MVKIARFFSVGTFNTVFCYFLFVLLVKSGLHYNLALAIDYVTGVIIGYILNRSWTFAGQGIPKVRFIKYVVTYVGAFALNAFFLFLLVEFVHMTPAIGQIFAFGAVTIITFLVQNYWVFRGTGSIHAKPK